MSEKYPQEKTIIEGSPEAMALAVLPKLPDLDFEAEIGRGGMGTVWRAHQAFLDRKVAVKVLSSEKGKWNQTTIDRFRREAKILASLTHPHIVACYNAGATDDNQLYIVMELVAGPNLGQYLREHPPLSSLQTARLARHIASALQYGAERGVIHRDVKAENILLRPEEGSAKDAKFPFVPKLVDLGLAKYQAHGKLDGNTITQSGVISGTPSVMAPEQFDDPDQVDLRSDIYALGCVMHRALTGKNPFEGLTFTQLMQAKMAVGPPRVRDAAKDVDPALELLVAQMMDRDRNKRPQTYSEIITRLEAMCPPGSSSAATRPDMLPPANLPPPIPDPSLGTGMWVGMGVVALAIVAGGWYYMASEGNKSAPPPTTTRPGTVAFAAPVPVVDPPPATRPSTQPSPTPVAIELLWDQDGESIWGQTKGTRMAEWTTDGEATWVADDTLGEGILATGSGQTEKSLGEEPWRVLGSLAVVDSPDVAVFVRLADERRVALRLQDFGGGMLASVGTESAPDATGQRGWTATASATPAEAQAHSFRLTALADRIELALDETPVGVIAIDSPPVAFGLGVRGGAVRFFDLSLHRPL